MERSANVNGGHRSRVFPQEDTQRPLNQEHSLSNSQKLLTNCDVTLLHQSVIHPEDLDISRQNADNTFDYASQPIELNDRTIPLPQTNCSTKQQQQQQQQQQQNERMEHSKQATDQNLGKEKQKHTQFEECDPNKQSQRQLQLQQQQQNSNEKVKNAEINDLKAFDFTDKRFRLVSKFVNKIKQFSPTLKFANSTKQQLAKINDPTFHWDILFREGIFHKEKPTTSDRIVNFIDQKVLKVLNIESTQSLVITPDSMLSRIWDTIQFITLLISMIFLPIFLAFNTMTDSSAAFIICEVIPNLIQIINMFLEFDTGFYQHGIVILDRKQIFLHYIKGKFIFDFTLNICWIVSLMDGSSNWFKAFGLLRMIVLVYLLGEIEETFNLRENLGNYFDLLKLSGFIFISAHFCGCLWYALGAYEKEIGVKHTWLDKDLDYFESEETLSPLIYAYIAAFYWAIVTMCTVGYGDIGPTTYRERIFVIFIVLASSFVFGFSMNQIGSIIQNMRQKEEEMKNTIATLNLYMKKRKLNKEMQLKVRRYYEYIFLHKNEDNEKGRQLIDDLTPCLREEVNRDIYTAMFKNQKIFSMNFTDSFLTKLYRIVDERQCRAEEQLYAQGERSTKLFYILKGEVNLSIGNQTISYIPEGKFLGPVEFFSDRVHEFSAKTTRLTQVAVIDRDQFMELVRERKEDFIKDQIRSYQDSSSIGHACESCGKHGHIFDNCTLIKFHANKHKQIYEFTSLKQITRQKWARRSLRVPALAENTETQNTVRHYRDSLEISASRGASRGASRSTSRGRIGLREEEIDHNLEIDLTESAVVLPSATQNHSPTAKLIESLLDLPNGTVRDPKEMKSEKVSIESREQKYRMKENSSADKKSNARQELPVGVTEIAPLQKTRWIESQRKTFKQNLSRYRYSGRSIEVDNDLLSLPNTSDRRGLVGPVTVVDGDTTATTNKRIDGLSPVKKTVVVGESEKEKMSVRIEEVPVAVNQTNSNGFLDEGFDGMHEFSHYFVKNNYSNVLRRVKEFAEKSALYQNMLKREHQRDEERLLRKKKKKSQLLPPQRKSTMMLGRKRSEELNRKLLQSNNNQINHQTGIHETKQGGSPL